MGFTDFKVKYFPETDSPLDLTKRILYSIVIRRMKFHKPAILFISGDSGEGKSFGALKLQEILLEMAGLKLIDYLEDINVHTPLEYPKKLDNLLNDKKRLKKIDIICMHEAREIIKAKMWHSFLNQAVADVNAMSRSIKPLCIMIVSQFIRDISTDIRYTLNYYMKCSRPMGGNKRTRLYISVMWKDDRDLEKPKLRKRKLTGHLIYPDGTMRRYTPKYLELTRPSKEVVDIFEKNDFESKQKILKNKIRKLITVMENELNFDNKKIDAMVTFYMKNPENRALIIKYKRGDKFIIKKEAKAMHDLDDEELKEFQNKLNEEFNKGIKIDQGDKIAE